MKLIAKMVHASLVFSALSLASLPPLYAGTPSESQVPVSSEIVDMHDGLNFPLDFVQLQEGKMQIATKLFTPHELLASAYNSWDVDHDSVAMHEDEVVVLTQTAFVFPQVEPEFFQANHVMTHEFIARAMGDGEISNVDTTACSFKCEKNYYHMYTITSNIHYGFYDLLHDNGTNLSRTEVDSFLKMHHHSEKPEVISVVRAAAGDIDFGSHGLRTFNFYYRINSSGTLLVSYKFVTIKKESQYESFWWRNLGVWERVLKGIREESANSNLKSLKELREYATRVVAREKFH